MKEIKLENGRKIIQHSDLYPEGILEVDGDTIETSGLSSKMASEAYLIFTNPPFQDQEVLILKNRWGPKGRVSMADFTLYKALAEKSILEREASK